MEGIVLAQLATCVPRACRLTRVCMHYKYSEKLGVDDMFLKFDTSADCENDGYTEHLLPVPTGVGAFISNCFCAELNVLFDECALWQASFLMGGVTFPLARVNFHFELR
jgi:hypothetical protein